MVLGLDWVHSGGIPSVVALTEGGAETLISRAAAVWVVVGAAAAAVAVERKMATLSGEPP